MKKECTCKICGRKLLVVEAHKISDPKTHYHYECGHCYNRRLDYSQEVQDTTLFIDRGFIDEKGCKVNSTSTKIPTTISHEMEVGHGVDARKFANLQQYGYVPSYDCTVQVEYKSPIYKSLNGMAKTLRSVIDNQGLTIGEGASTHINVWCETLTSKDYDRVRNYYDILFKPLYDEVKTTKNVHACLWGRRIDGRDGLGGRSWASGFDNYNHSNFINTESCKRNHPRIEFRLCRYDNNKQFMLLNRMIDEMMKALVINFFNHYMTDTKAISQGLTPNDATKNNQHKAEITSKKLVKIYNKYLAKAQNL